MNFLTRATSCGALALIGIQAANGQGAQTASSSNLDSANLETVVVTGQNAEISAAEAELALIPGGTTLIDMSQAIERNAGNLADALENVPGIWAVSPTGDDNIFFTSRGSNLDATYYDMNGIKLLQDGLPVTTADGNNHNRVIDPLAARYATMARGANAMSFGSSTLGGAINFVTPTARNGAGNSLSLSMGSHEQALGRLTLSHLFGDSADALITIEGKSRDGYREHNEQDRGGIYANAGWQFAGGWTTRFFLTGIHNDSELSSPLSRDQIAVDPAQANPAVTGNFQVDVDTARFANVSTWQIDSGRSLQFGFSVEEQSLFHPIVWSPFFSLLIDTDQSNIGSMLRYRQQSGNHDLLFGLNYGRNRVEGGNYSHDGGMPTALWATTENTASTTEVFAMDHWQVAQGTTLVLAAQAVSAERDALTTQVPSGAANHPRASYDRINPRIGIIQELGTGLDLYGNVSRLFEPPTNYELEDNVTGGNATLRPMEGTVVELGLRGTGRSAATDSLSWDVAVYHASIDNEILSVDDPLAPGTSLSTNVDKTVHAGIEAIFRSAHGLGNRGARIEPLVSLTVNDFAFDGDPDYADNELPGAPDYFVRGEIIYRGANGYFFGPTFERVGDRWADFANTYKVEAYSLFGLRGGYSQERWRVFVDVRNVSDKDYVAYHYVRNSLTPGAEILFPGEPLSAYAGFEISFD